MGERPRWMLATFVLIQLLYPLVVHINLALTGVKLPGGWTMFSGL